MGKRVSASHHAAMDALADLAMAPGTGWVVDTADALGFVYLHGTHAWEEYRHRMSVTPYPLSIGDDITWVPDKQLVRSATELRRMKRPKSKVVEYG